MNVHDIILKEQQLDEKPTSSIGNFAKKVASKVTTGGTSARLGGSAEMGSKANAIYKDLARWQGINQKNDKNMIKAFNNNIDIHSSTASKIFNVRIDEITREQRSNAKTVNFGNIYGESAFGLSQQTNLNR